MAKKIRNKKVENEILAEIEEKAKVKEVEKVEEKAEAYRVKEGLEFTSRNYNAGGKRIHLEAGKTISKADYLLFNSQCQKNFFEKV